MEAKILGVTRKSKWDWIFLLGFSMISFIGILIISWTSKKFLAIYLKLVGGLNRFIIFLLGFIGYKFIIFKK